MISCKRAFIAILTGISGLTPVLAQMEVRTEVQATAASGDHNPLWLNANKHGLSSLETTNGYLRAGLFRQAGKDSLKRWDWGFGADVAVASGFTSTIVVQQAYADVTWLKGRLTLGSKEQPMELRNRELSSGPQTLGENARPLPGARLELPSYWDVPYTRGWIGFKGHIYYGMQTDDGWQKDFTSSASRHTEYTKLHTKAGYLRIGKTDHPLTAELGLEMGCQFGGTSIVPSKEADEAPMRVENEDGLKGMIRALVPGGGEATETTYRNTSGNHVGSWVARVNYDRESWGVSVYADHYFEDQSGMFFLDYNGYGTGSQWDEWVDSRWFVYDLKDMQLGVEVRLRNFRWANRIVGEYLYTKYQSGPLYHDHTITMSDHVCGIDNYYNHGLNTGWQHWGQVMGNPLYRSPLYNDDGIIGVEDNRFWAWHVGVSGDPLAGLHYRVLATVQRGWGTYGVPLPDPQRNLSLLLEGGYALKGGWAVKAAFALDRGQLLGDNTGAQLTVSRHFNL